MARSFAQQLSTRTREAEALELRSQGRTYDDIATELGFSNRGAAHKAVQRALLATIRQPAEVLRTLQMERLEEAFRALWPKATDPDHAHHLRAVDSMLSVLDRMDRLTGLTETPKQRGNTCRSPAGPERPDCTGQARSPGSKVTTWPTG